MQITGLAPIGKSDNHLSTGGEAQGTAQAQEPAVNVSDRIMLTDFARLNLLIPPGDQLRLAQLQEQVNSGQYGPPAASIAEGLITLAIARGLKI